MGVKVRKFRWFSVPEWEKEEKRKLYVITDLGKDVLNLEKKRIKRLYQNLMEVEI